MNDKKMSSHQKIRSNSVCHRVCSVSGWPLLKQIEIVIEINIRVEPSNWLITFKNFDFNYDPKKSTS